MVEQIVKGMQEENVSAVLKHFPGHGDASKDSHKGAVIIEHGIERLREIEFVPFEKGISADADAIMTAHIILPEIDSDDLPATLSKKILTGLLRKELNYDGLIITDALEMEAIKNIGLVIKRQLWLLKQVQIFSSCLIHWKRHTMAF